MTPNKQNKSIIVLSLVIFLVIAPILAWITTPHNTAKKERSFDEFYSLIKQYNKTADEASKIPEIKITSVHRVEDVWYVVDIHPTNSAEKGKMLFADFYHDPAKMDIIVKPFETFTQQNISGIGVPYSVIDEINSTKPEVEE